MFPSDVDYVRAASLDDAALSLARMGPAAMILAGGTIVIPRLKARMSEVSGLVDIGGLDDLRYIRGGDQRIEIGALTRESEIGASQLLHDRFPILVEASGMIADPIIRNMGTFGGAIANGGAGNDHAATALALGARLVVASGSGTAEFDADAFYVDAFKTVMRADEILVAVRIKSPQRGEGTAYVRLPELRGEFPAAAVWVSISNGIVRSARIAVTNAGPMPMRLAPVEDRLTGQRAEPSSAEAAGRQAGEAIQPWDEPRGSVAYKRQIAGVVVAGALRMAFDRAASADR